MTETEQKNLALTQEYYAAGTAGDWAKVASMITPDFVINEGSDLPFAGEYHGIEGMQQVYGNIFTKMDITRYEIYQTVAGGDFVISLMDIFARDKDGVEVRMPVAETLLWRDGKLAEMKPYWFDSNGPKRVWEARAPA